MLAAIQINYLALPERCMALWHVDAVYDSYSNKNM